MTPRPRLSVLVAIVAALLTACSGGGVTAQLRQSSHDAAPQRMQVWIQNGTATLSVQEGEQQSAVPVEDPNDLVARHTASRHAVARVRTPPPGLVLVVEPTGRPGSFTIDEVNGTRSWLRSVVPMSETGARSALGFALETCGF